MMRLPQMTRLPLVNHYNKPLKALRKAFKRGRYVQIERCLKRAESALQAFTKSCWEYQITKEWLQNKHVIRLRESTNPPVQPRPQRAPGPQPKPRYRYQSTQRRR